MNKLVLPYPTGAGVNHLYVAASYGQRRLSDSAQSWKASATVTLNIQGDLGIFRAPLHTNSRYSVGIQLVPQHPKRKRDVDGPVKIILDLVARWMDIDDREFKLLTVSMEDETPNPNPWGWVGVTISPQDRNWQQSLPPLEAFWPNFAALRTYVYLFQNLPRSKPIAHRPQHTTHE